MRFARPLVIAVLVLLIAVTPLGAFLSGGVHETWLPGYYSATYARPRTHVVLLDHTGLVRAIGPAPEEVAESPMVLPISWYGCDGGSTLTFDRREDRYVIADQTLFECSFWNGNWRTLDIHLRSPIDPSKVDLALPH